jgi:hypothetical protein
LSHEPRTRELHLGQAEGGGRRTVRGRFAGQEEQFQRGLEFGKHVVEVGVVTVTPVIVSS